MSFHAVVAALDIANLDPGSKFLLVVLASYAGADNTLWPSQSRLASDTCMSDRTIRTHLTALQRRGLIHRTHRRIGNRQTSDMISLLFVPEKSAAAKPFEAENIAASCGKKRHPDAENISAKPVIEPIIEPYARETPRLKGASRSADDNFQAAIAMKQLAESLGANRRVK